MKWQQTVVDLDGCFGMNMIDRYKMEEGKEIYS